MFQFILFLEDKVYEYGFSVRVERVYEEWLMILSEKDFIPSFTDYISKHEGSGSAIAYG